LATSGPRSPAGPSGDEDRGLSAGVEKEMGMMRKRIGRLTRLLCLAGMLLIPQAALGQEIIPPTTFPWPLGNPRYEEGGFYMAGEFLFLKQSNPIKPQFVAAEGFTDRDGSIAAALGLPGGPGTFIGSRQQVLNTSQVGGPVTYSPGFNFVMGWLFRNQLAVEISWIHLVDARYSATASLNRPGNPGVFLENTFLTAPVHNYPTDYDGPGNQVGIGNPGATSGIWNAANLMTIDFVQRFDQFALSVRYPLHQAEGWRSYGLFGPKIVAMWERFKWRTVDADVNGVALADDVANYTNVVSNRLYGVDLGIGNECMIGYTPLGAFSVSLDLRAALFADFIKGRAKYEIGDFHTAASRARNLFTLAPGAAANLNLWWFPYPGVQVRAGYDVMAFFNTVAAPRPIDFNYGALAPAWEKGITRFFHGINFGFAFTF
jgi:hypothetical protein